MEQNNRPTLADGKICYLEIPAIDIDVSSAFYKEVFGWRVRTTSDGRMAFDDTVNEVSGAWVLGRAAVADPGFVLYIMVYDIEATVRAITARGGTIVQPVGVDAPEITARFSDPAGNIFGLYQQPNR